MNAPTRGAAVPAALCAAGMLLAAFYGCSGEVSPTIALGIDGCRECGMVIGDGKQACGFVRGGTFVTFDSPGCLLMRYEALRKRGDELPTALFFADYGDGALRPVESVTFLLTEHLPTVMDRGVVCYGSREAAQRARRFDDEILTDWAGFRVARGEPDREFEIVIDGDGMSPDVLQASKGELLLFRLSGRSLARDVVLEVKGYPEAGSVTVPAGGGEVAFWPLAERPGDGFPVVQSEGGTALGMLKVAGTHTTEEEQL